MTDALHAIEAGADGEWLVLIHGFGGLAVTWHKVIDALSPHARILAYDLPGHGRSLNYPGAGPVKVSVRAIIEDLDSRGITRFHLAGHSMGGAISALIALKAPDRVASLTLLAPGGIGEDINRDHLMTLARAQTAAELQAALAAMSGPASVQNPEILAMLEQSRRVPGQTEMLTSIAEAITRGGKQGVISPDQLAKLTMPVTVIWGRLDSTLPYDQTERLPANFHLIGLHDTAHMLIEEALGPVINVTSKAIGMTPDHASDPDADRPGLC